ncbi:MAG: FAD-binding oxidoreductase [Gemmatimonadaceae bacterium]
MSALVDRDADLCRSFSADASGLVMQADAVARPKSVAEVREVLRQAQREGVSVTPAGGQTSTTGASITDQGIVLSLRGLDRIGDVDESRQTLRVEAGALIGDVKRVAAAHGLLFAPDPTSEEEATIGGAIACNASGARSLAYGSTRAHVRGLSVLLANGQLLELRRPMLEKNTVGYGFAQDPLDWFVGSEGTLGVVVAAELALTPVPHRLTGLGFPFPTEAAALAFVVAARDSVVARPRCLEFFDERAFAIARSTYGRANWAPFAGAFVYAEADVSPETDASIDAWLALAERHLVAVEDVCIFEGDAALREARSMRHAVPLHMNERGNASRPAGGRKVSTDWAVPFRRLGEAIQKARRLAHDASIAQSVVYGHAGNGHPHQNFIAADAAELERVEAVVEETLRFVLSLGGTVAAEHGIGKLKRRWLPMQITPLQMGVMRAVKRELDPDGMFAPGNIL